MAKFVVGRPLTTRESTIVVDPGLPTGVHRFQLVVVDANGVASKPDQVLVQVQTAPLRPAIGTPPIVNTTPVRPPRNKGSPL
jgi:hypothetical protein